jgi:hypothetical protein
MGEKPARRRHLSIPVDDEHVSVPNRVHDVSLAPVGAAMAAL